MSDLFFLPALGDVAALKGGLYQFERCCPLVAEQDSLCSSGMDSGLSCPLASSEGLASGDEDDEYLAELTCQMAYHTLLELDDEDDKKPDSVPDVHTSKGCETRRWVDLFAVSSPQSTLWSPSSLTRCSTKASVADNKLTSESSSTDEDLGWDSPLAYQPKIEETFNKTESVQKKSCCDQNSRNHDCELNLNSNQAVPKHTSGTRDSFFRPERVPKRADPAKGKPHARNDQWRMRRGLVHGECYVDQLLPQQQKCYPPRVASSGTRAVFLNSRSGSTGTGVFLPRTGRNPAESPRRKPRSSTVLIPARVAQALMVHFSKTSPQSPSSAGGGGGIGGSLSIQPDASGRFGVGPFFRQQKGQPEEP